MNRLNPVTVALIAGALLVLLVGGLLLARQGDADQDKLNGDESSASASADPEKRCASAKTYDLIKRDLFRRAAQVRGSDQAAFDSLAAYAALRVDRPVMEREDEDRGSVYCSGQLALDLPPGVAVVGGRRTLVAEVDYELQRSADGAGDVLTLHKADAIVTPLATLARTASPQTSPSSDPLSNSADPTYDGPGEATPDPLAPVPVAPPPPVARPQQPSASQPTATTRPSFNCANARTRGERAVCSSSDLASLDRQMASQFGRAIADATPGEREMLQRSRTRFLSYRDRCTSDACIADAYQGRIREISDIMSGRWAPPR
ncbi:hypothetical protein G7077_00050 [Sphingomonas piscis]|uniref:DUF1311 domain-containing protein n=1 Tax=Sphingomonas piscis TaxID=2714943 RepID=A0A6G7YLD4_9SPHN|nr:hypothetical protein [Sphingomonas piscis]QIK77550.1 hypothetical protein G7077_00050 [Sphingomonas piscis]